MFNPNQPPPAARKEASAMANVRVVLTSGGEMTYSNAIAQIDANNVLHVRRPIGNPADANAALIAEFPHGAYQFWEQTNSPGE